jgi:hypothetical protein
MKEWAEINVGEDLLVQVVRELLDLAADPNQVEVVYGTTGRVILAEVHLADAWYQDQLAKDKGATESATEEADVVTVEASKSVIAEVSDPAPSPPPPMTQESATTESDVAKIEISISDVATVSPTPLPPVRRGPGRPRKEPQPSASPKGEES